MFAVRLKCDDFQASDIRAIYQRAFVQFRRAQLLSGKKTPDFFARRNGKVTPRELFNRNKSRRQNFSKVETKPDDHS